MAHVIEPATSGRAKCRGCGRRIEKGELRFGDREPSMFGDGEMTLWFHPLCAAYKRPEPLLETIERERVSDADRLIEAARFGIEHRRLPRLHGAERSPTGRARCRHCRNLIEKDAWRIPLVFFEEARFEPSGFIHAGCARDYFGTTDILDRVRQFSPDLSEADLADLARALG
ncbi:MAG TPA: hypothetical protein VF322_03190 [Gammaproteobacteria bacterium]